MWSMRCLPAVEELAYGFSSDLLNEREAGLPEGHLSMRARALPSPGQKVGGTPSRPPSGFGTKTVILRGPCVPSMLTLYSTAACSALMPLAPAKAADHQAFTELTNDMTRVPAALGQHQQQAYVHMK